MENSISSPAGALPNRKKLWFFLIVAFIIILAALYYQKVRVTTNKQGIPQNFLLSNSLSAAPKANPSDYVLGPNQQIAPGVQYQLPMARAQAVQKVYAQVQKEGWVAIGGTQQETTKTILQIGKGTSVLGISFIDAGANSTTVSIYKIEHK